EYACESPKKNTIKSIFGTATLSFCSVTTDHIYGSFLGILYLDIPTHMYAEVIPNFVEERLFMVLIGTVFTTMVIYLTKKILEYAPKIYDKMLEKYIDEYMQDKNDCNEVDLELLKKYNVKYPSQKEQKEMLKKVFSQISKMPKDEIIKRK
ncbi:hypothetical protein MetfoDRAFT_1767, partial [Methanotorris formicicus Mc-S-70]